MKQAGVLDDPASITPGLLETIRRAYAIPFVSLEYMPVGFVGIHYKACDSHGKAYFITVYDGTRLAQISANRLSFTLPAIYHLQQSGQFSDLVVPLPARQGQLSLEHKGMSIIVYPFLDGHLLAEEDGSQEIILVELGRLAARLHSTSLDQRIKDPVKEQYRFHFEAPLRQCLVDLESVKADASSEKKALRNLILPQNDKIGELLQRLHELAAHMRSISPPFVICHTDIHPWNVIRTLDRRLVVIDWEGICLAPAEHDLFGFTGPGFKTFLQAYYRAGGKRNLTPEGFSFYFYRRNLEDLTDFIMRILHENGGQERDRKDLEGIGKDCMADWPYLDTALERMRSELKEE